MNDDYTPQNWDSKIGTAIAWVAGGLVLLNIIVQILHAVGAIR